MNERQKDCKHERLPLPAFDYQAAIGLSSDEVRKRWPRTTEKCPDCELEFMAVYASFAHYVAGDW